MEVALLTRRLADLTNGGMTLTRSFNVLRTQSQNQQIRPLMQRVQLDLESGKSLSQALALQNGTFSQVYIGLVKAGESSGTLESALEELAQLLESEVESKQKLRAAIAYPAFLLILAAAVAVFLTVFVIPRFEFLFQDLGQRLPLPTRILIGVSVIVQKEFWLLLLTLGAGGFLLFKYRKQWTGWIQKFLLRYSWSREMIQSAYLHRWARLMSSLTRSGFTISDALQLSRHTFANSFYSAEVGLVIRRVLEGSSLAEALNASPLFPPMVCELVNVGEEAAQLDQTFLKIAQTYRREMEVKMKLALTLLEPALILTMGLVVGFVAMGMLLPIFEMSASFR